MANKGLEAVGATVLGTCFFMLLFIPMLIVDIALMGYATKVIWNMFLPALGVGIPAITFAQAAGIRMVWSTFYRRGPTKKSGPASTSEQDVEFLIGMGIHMLVSPFMMIAIAHGIKYFLF